VWFELLGISTTELRSIELREHTLLLEGLDNVTKGLDKTLAFVKSDRQAGWTNITEACVFVNFRLEMLKYGGINHSSGCHDCDRYVKACSSRSVNLRSFDELEFFA
jgi:hypothetical protein